MFGLILTLLALMVALRVGWCGIAPRPVDGGKPEDAEQFKDKVSGRPYPTGFT